MLFAFECAVADCLVTQLRCRLIAV